MNQLEIEHALADLPLGEIHYFDSLGSTNDEAIRWISSDPPNLSLVIADEQTSGRGRAGRRWLTPRGSALAFSVILSPKHVKPDSLALINGLGALAVSDALKQIGLSPVIKWPNDVLINGMKVSGILPEAQWVGAKLRGVVLGIGINVRRDAVPPASSVNFLAGCVEEAVGEAVDRLTVLRAVISALLNWLEHVGAPSFVNTWEDRLAFRNEWVKVIPPIGDPMEGELIGLTSEGNLRLMINGIEKAFSAGEIHLRPMAVDKNSKISTLNSSEK